MSFWRRAVEELKLSTATAGNRDFIDRPITSEISYEHYRKSGRATGEMNGAETDEKELKILESRTRMERDLASQFLP